MRRLAKRAMSPDALTLTLMLSALACLPVTLRVAAPDAAITLLLPVILLSGAAGFIAYAPGSLSKGVRIAFLLLGPVVLFVRAGELVEAIWGGTRASMQLVAMSLLPSQDFPGNLQYVAMWLQMQGHLWSQVAEFARRSLTWLSGLMHLAAIADLAARAFWLSTGLWFLAVWAGWRIRSKDDPLGAVLPTTLLIAFTLNNSIQERWPLWVNITSLLLLLVVMHVNQLMGGWKAERRDFSDSIGEDTLLSSIVVIIALLVVAYAASVFSLKDMLDKWREQQKPGSSEVTSAGEGGSAASAMRAGDPTLLQTNHMITAGPKLSDDVVMSISTGDLPPMQYGEGIEVPRYYWRGATYQTYTGGGWSNPTTTLVQLPPGNAVREATVTGYHEVHGAVTIPGGSGLAYWTGALIEADTPLEILWRSQPVIGEGTSTIAGALENGDMIGAQFTEFQGSASQTYRFDSLIPEVDEEQLRAASPSYPAWVTRRYLQLPDSVPERVLGLARDLTARGATPYDRALAIETYLRGIPYSLDVPAPPSGRDAADYFLFDLKKGYCDYYATSMAVLARAAGLPARLVTGFAPGSYDIRSAQYIIRDADAHAWTEIYFAGIGWIEFEPTSSQPAPERELPGGEPAGSRNQPTSPKPWELLPTMRIERLRWMLWSIPSILILFLAGLTIDGLRLQRMASAESTRRVYHRLRRATRALHANPPAGETAREYAADLTRQLMVLGGRSRPARAFVQSIAQSLSELTSLYTQSLFAPNPPGGAEAGRAVRIWFSLRWKLALVNVVLLVRRQPTAARGAPSIDRGSRAG